MKRKGRLRENFISEKKTLINMGILEDVEVVVVGLEVWQGNPTLRLVEKGSEDL